DGEHAIELVQEIEAAVFVQMNDDFGVAMVGGKPVSGALELLAQLDVVVDLAVEDDRNGAVFVEDRLLTGGHVDDRQTAHPQRYVRRLPVAGGVRPAVAQAFGHRGEHGAIVRSGESSYAAHDRSAQRSP